MESVELRSSSEDDDDDVYCNSVAKLKVLKKKQISHCNNEKDEKNKQENKEKLKIEVPKEIVAVQRTNIKTRRKTASRRRSRKQRQRRNQQGSDSDLEIVSVEEKPNSSENDVLIVEKNVEEKAQSSEDENYEINIKVMWRSKDLHRLNMCRNENFRRIFEYFANIEQVSIDEILITKTDKIIKKNDTPVTINLSVIDILEGGIITKDSTMLQKNAGGKDENVCVIKVQTTNKKSLTISVKRDENFQNLLEKCAQELNVEESKIKLYFDGELIVITDTPDSLEIEDEACFDLRLSC